MRGSASSHSVGLSGLAVCAAALVLILIAAAPLFGHGTQYELFDRGVIGVRAAFDSGEPMAEAPVLIFAPGQEEPEMTLKTDRRGIVCFAPNRVGTWVLQVRAEGGHGMRINLVVEDSMVATAGSNTGSFSLWQKLLMAICVVWGFLATALFFRRPERRKEES